MSDISNRPTKKTKIKVAASNVKPATKRLSHAPERHPVKEGKYNLPAEHHVRRKGKDNDCL